MDSMTIIRDPSLARNRIFIGNIPDGCNKRDLEETFGPFGPILAVLIQKNFAFIQYESEAVANKAASITTGIVFQGNRINVRNAGSGGKFNKKNAQNQSQQQQQQKQMQQKPMATNFAPAPAPVPPVATAPFTATTTNTNPDYNDCEIIVVAKALTEYAEYIETRLKRLGLKVDLLFPNEDVPIGKVLANISSRGCLYAVLVTPQNEEHRSITVNILHGQQAEHRNMPVEDAINLISTDFKIRNTKEPANVPMSVPMIPLQSQNAAPIVSTAAPPLRDSHPEAMQTLLNLLAKNLPLTVLQYDRIIKYLQERRAHQVKAELGDAADLAPPPEEKQEEPDPEIELQKKILSILNKPPITSNIPDMVYPDIESLKGDIAAVELLQDERVRKALDSLMSTDLVGTVEKFYHF